MEVLDEDRGAEEPRAPRSRGILSELQPRVDYIPPMARTGVPFRNPLTGWQPSGGDRFIPDRSAMDLDVAHYLLTESRKENTAELSPREEAYRRILRSTLMPNRNRILAFKGRAATRVAFRDLLSETESTLNPIPKMGSKRRFIPHFAGRTLDASGLVDDFYLNLLDWGSNNKISVAVDDTVYLWDASVLSVSELTTVNQADAPISSVSWASDCDYLAVGLHSSDVQLWDFRSHDLVRTLTGTHQSRVGSLAWNKNTLTTGGLDGLIVNTDVRMRSPIVSTYQGHSDEICGLKWSGTGMKLASGGNDKLVHIWDSAMASSSTNSIQNQWLHRFRDHTAAVKALAWCPFENNLLATGGGSNDRSIRFWNVNNGSHINTIDTGSQVSGLLWSKHERELLSTHGQIHNQLTLWKYPAMTKVAELMGHTARILHLAHSPNGNTVATASADETVRFWNVFGTPEVKKDVLPFDISSHIHIR